MPLYLWVIFSLFEKIIYILLYPTLQICSSSLVSRHFKFPCSPLNQSIWVWFLANECQLFLLAVLCLAGTFPFSRCLWLGGMKGCWFQVNMDQFIPLIASSLTSITHHILRLSHQTGIDFGVSLPMMSRRSAECHSTENLSLWPKLYLSILQNKKWPINRRVFLCKKCFFLSLYFFPFLFLFLDKPWEIINGMNINKHKHFFRGWKLQMC